MKKKICTKCSESKPLDKFHNHKECKLGVSSICKKCTYEAQKECRRKYPERQKRRQQLYYAKNKGKIAEKTNQWRKSNVERCKALIKANHRKLRDAAIDVYGGKCIWCGITDKDILTIDHINNDGAAHRRLGFGMRINRWLRKNNYPEGFQILCRNCNWKKRLQVLEEVYNRINQFTPKSKTSI